jgi:hypothetical protein
MHDINAYNKLGSKESWISINYMNCQTLKDRLLVQDMNGCQHKLPPVIFIFVTLKIGNEILN